MEKQKTLTVITGFSLRDKSEFIKKMLGKESTIKVVLYRPTDVELVCHSDEDPFSLSLFMTEAIHHIEVNKTANLIPVLEEELFSEHVEEIILDLYPIANLDVLIGSLASLRHIHHSHIHVLNTREFWNTFFSEYSIQPNEMDAALSLEYTFGETLIQQLEHAGTIYLTNADQISAERLAELTSFIQNLQPNVAIRRFNEITNWDMNLESLIPIKTTDQLYSDQIKLFLSRRNLDMIGQHGIDTFVYQSVFPIDFTRLENFFKLLPNEVFRMKGKCYNPSTHEQHTISQVGTSILVDTIDVDPDKSDDILTEFLFIGSELNNDEIEDMLNNCLQISSQRKLAY
ncbi:GTP-binding protein [Halalkalibacter sp. APA_J-10(15)]|uniref:GTP-binding protein n=1 Tax=Halalkalibacter sp. APA_J-10(15) TaxID=2933805 RepID=UPI001FF65915|nr:GTP-binding protein [Halalkalibacter sp. APA_J-10(15)]MCK0471181.1 GTP-binding protein [Halalkalibacter sp. APA_J-10(15)]